MTVSISNLTATFANSSYRYDAIGMDVETGGQAENSTLFNLKANSVTKFSVDIDGNITGSGNISISGDSALSGNVSLSGNVAASGANIAYHIGANTINANVINVKTVQAGNTAVTGNLIANIVNSNIVISKLISTGNLTVSHNITSNVLVTGTLHANSINLGGSLLTVARRSFYVPAASMMAQVTSGPSANTFQIAATDPVMWTVLEFASTGGEGAQFDYQMPSSWDGTALTAQILWFHANTITNYSVSWNIAAVSLANNEFIGASFPATVSVAHAGNQNNRIYFTPETPEFTVSGAAPGELVKFRIRRDTSSGSDNLGVDAKLIGATIYYNTNSPVG